MGASKQDIQTLIVELAISKHLDLDLEDNDKVSETITADTDLMDYRSDSRALKVIAAELTERYNASLPKDLRTKGTIAELAAYIYENKEQG
jgi:hypothetical protein